MNQTKAQVEMAAKADFEANRAHYVKSRISLEDLTTTMLVDAGLEELRPATMEEKPEPDPAPSDKIPEYGIGSDKVFCD